MPLFERHVFVCHNVRSADAPRPSCTRDGKSELHARLRQLTKDAGLAGRVRINKSLCLDQREHGPTVVVYAEGVWYGNVRPQDAEEIVTEHLIGRRPVERLRIAEECMNTKSCPHRSSKTENREQGTGNREQGLIRFHRWFAIPEYWAMVRDRCLVSRRQPAKRRRGAYPGQVGA